MSLLLRVHDVSQTVEPAIQNLTGRRVRGRRILDVSEIEAENGLSKEVDSLVAVKPKKQAKNTEQIDLLSKLPALKYAKRQNTDFSAEKERKAKKKAKETEIALLLMDFLD